MGIRRYGDWPLRVKILLSLNFFIIIQLTVFFFFSVRTSSKMVLDSVVTSTQDKLSLALERCQSVLDGARRGADQLFYAPRMIDLLKSLNEVRADNSIASSEIYGSLRAAVSAFPDIRAISIITSGKVFFYGKNIYFGETIERKSAEIAAIAREGKGKAVHIDIPGINGYIALGRAMYSNDFNGPFAVFCLFIPAGVFYENFREVLKEDSSYFQLLDKKTRKELTAFGKVQIDKDSFFERAAASGDKSAAVFEDNELDLLISYRDLSTPPWRALLALPRDIIFEDLDYLFWMQALIAAAVLAVSSLVAFMLSGYIVKPLLSLVNELKKFEESPAKLDLKFKNKDEIGYLYSSVNRMSERLDRLINMVYRERIERKDAELKALQAQINPHFLFNTLETISWKARLDGSETAGDMISALSDMLRVNIGREGRDFITIAEEIEYLKNYFYLQNIRHEGMIEFKVNAGKDLLRRSIPCLTAQPLAENAIFHNSPVLKLLKIEFRLYKDCDKIIAEFRDNGKGISAETAKNINDSLSKNVSFIESGGGHKSVGLINVHKRIKLFFGGEYGISIAYEDRGARIIMSLPDKQINEGGADVQDRDN